MSQTRLSTKGQVIIPREIRNRQGWQTGTVLDVEDHGDFLVLRGAAAGPATTVDELLGILPCRGKARTLAQMKQGIAPFDDHSEDLGLSRSGWGWDAKFGDFDNSGNVQLVQTTGFCKGNAGNYSGWPWLHELATANDQLLKNPKFWFRCEAGDSLSTHSTLAFFARDEQGYFWDIGRDLGFTEGEIGRGVSTADVDGSGRLSFAVANQFGPSFFYRNECPTVGTFVGVRPILPLSPNHVDRISLVDGRPDMISKARPAVGAQAILHLPDGHLVKAQVDGGNGHAGRRTPELHFGVGNIPKDTMLKMDFTWRDGDGILHTSTCDVQTGHWNTATLGWPGKEQVNNER